jgi:hypothetical protein
MNVSAQDRARKIKIILFDVDGVLTDGGIWLIPVPVVMDGAATTRLVEAKGYTRTMGRRYRWRGWAASSAASSPSASRTRWPCARAT